MEPSKALMLVKNIRTKSSKFQSRSVRELHLLSAWASRPMKECTKKGSSRPHGQGWQKNSTTYLSDFFWKCRLNGSDNMDHTLSKFQCESTCWWVRNDRRVRIWERKECWQRMLSFSTVGAYVDFFFGTAFLRQGFSCLWIKHLSIWLFKHYNTIFQANLFWIIYCKVEELLWTRKCEIDILIHLKKFGHICLEFSKGGLEGLYGTPTRNSRTP